MFKYPIFSPSLDGQVFIVIGIVTKKELVRERGREKRAGWGWGVAICTIQVRQLSHNFVTKFYFCQTDKSKTNNQIAWRLSKIRAQMARGRAKLPTAFQPAWCLLHAFKREPNQRLNRNLYMAHK